MAELELSPGERDGRGGIVGEVAELVLQAGTELAELKLLAGEKAGRAGNFGWGESWRSWNFWWGRELAELEMLAGERAG